MVKQDKVDLLLKGVLEGVQDFYTVFDGEKKGDVWENEGAYISKNIMIDLELYFKNLLQMNLEPEYKKQISKKAQIHTLNDMKTRKKNKNELAYKDYLAEDRKQGKENRDKRNKINDACYNIVSIIQGLKLPSINDRVEHFSDVNNYTAKENAKNAIVKELQDIVSALDKSNDNASFKVNPAIMYAIVKKLYKDTKKFKRQGFDDTLAGYTTLEEKLGNVLKESRTLGIKPCRTYDGKVELESVADALLYGADGNVKDKSCFGRSIAVITMLALLTGGTIYLMQKCPSGKYEKKVAPQVATSKDIKLPEPSVQPPKHELEYKIWFVQEGENAWKTFFNQEFGIYNEDSIRVGIEHFIQMNPEHAEQLSKDTKKVVNGKTVPGSDGYSMDELKVGTPLTFKPAYISSLPKK